jgi:cytochrome P450
MMIAPMDNASTAFAPEVMFDFPDPYPLFADMRRSQPVAYVEMVSRSSYVVTRYDDVLTILRDGDTFSSRANAEVGKYMGRTIIEMDGTEHAHMRAVISSVFTPRSIEAIAARVEALVQEIIDGFAADGRADLIPQLSTAFPIQVIAEMVGVPRADYQKFQRWSLDLVGFARNPAGGLVAARTLREYLLPFVRERRAEPRDDVLSKLVTGTVDGSGLSDDEVINFLRLLIPAGAETTARLIGSMLLALLVDRRRFERVDADRALVRSAIEETLRWETPVVFVARQTMRPTTLCGVDIPAGQLVSAVVGSANRDEAHFENPDAFDLDRRADDHLSFGFGRHFCLGSHLARLEARAALTAVFDRLPDVRIDASMPPPTVTGLAFRSPQALPVLFRSA